MQHKQNEANRRIQELEEELKDAKDTIEYRTETYELEKENRRLEKENKALRKENSVNLKYFLICRQQVRQDREEKRTIGLTNARTS